MSAETTLYAALSSAPAVVAIVADRIYPIFVPDGRSLPAIAYQRVATAYENTIGNADLARLVTFDVFCVADALNISAAENLADQVAAVTELVKTNRSSTFDSDSETVAVIMTVDVWE